MSKILAEDALRALLGASIMNVTSHEGSPGGHNNDQVTLTLSSGVVVHFDAYSPGLLRVTASSRSEEHHG